MSQRVLICGSRYWWNYEIILTTLRGLENVEIVIEGEAHGAFG
jgi:hypothetical protein